MADKITEEKKKVKEMLHVDYEPFPPDLVIEVDKIVDMARGSSGVVQTEADWKTVRQIFLLFVKAYPDKALDLYKSVKTLKREQVNDHGTKKEGEAWIQHQMEVPERFYQLFKAVYPNQKWDQRFVLKFVQVIPEVKAVEGHL